MSTDICGLKRKRHGSEDEQQSLSTEIDNTKKPRQCRSAHHAMKRPLPICCVFDMTTESFAYLQGIISNANYKQDVKRLVVAGDMHEMMSDEAFEVCVERIFLMKDRCGSIMEWERRIIKRYQISVGGTITQECEAICHLLMMIGRKYSRPQDQLQSLYQTYCSLFQEITEIVRTTAEKYLGAVMSSCPQLDEIELCVKPYNDDAEYCHGRLAAHVTLQAALVNKFSPRHLCLTGITFRAMEESWDKFGHVMKNVESFTWHLAYTSEEGDDEDDMNERLGEGALVDALQHASRLSCLDLAFPLRTSFPFDCPAKVHTWRQLQSLSLAGFSTCPESLETLFLQHSGTLKRIRLGNIIFKAKTDRWPTLFGTLSQKLTFLEDFTLRGAFETEDDDDDSNSIDAHCFGPLGGQETMYASAVARYVMGASKCFPEHLRCFSSPIESFTSKDLYSTWTKYSHLESS